MSRERLAEIRRLFEAALVESPERRADFLVHATPDVQLREEVARLLKAREINPGFPPESTELGETRTVGQPLNSLPGLDEGTILADRYEILGLLGRGGMGEVYQARDRKLRRSVALKLISSIHAVTPQRRRRFVDEARAASALNHPHIATIYDFGEENGLEYIAMEFVPGTTLDRMIQPPGLKLQDALLYAVQIAEGLAAAHAAGIVHRDVKPGNIIVAPNGVVKVLDFGLAKLSLPEAAVEDLASHNWAGTAEGMIVGTVAYMSPEQAEGKAVDARSDIFSFGCVMYEMLTGRRPFQGDSQISTLAAILHQNPEPLKKLAPAVPAEVESIVMRCLQKDPRLRFESSTEIAAALRSVVTGPAPQLSRRRIAIAAGILLVLGGALALFVRLGSSPAGELRFRQINMTRLTTHGKAQMAAISGDGKYVAYVVPDRDQGSIWLRQTGTESNIQVVGPGSGWIQRLAFSPDGGFIFYIGVNPSGIGTLYRVPALGGAPRGLVVDVDTGPTFSPDGKSIAYCRFSPPETIRLLIATIDGSGERVVSTQKTIGAVGQPAWSPDGSVIAWPNRIVETNSVYDALIVSPVDGGKETVVPAPKLYGTWGVQWTKDGRGLIISARETQAGVLRLWDVSYPDGKTRALTHDLADYRGVSLTHDATALVAVQTFQNSNLWVVDTRFGVPPSQISSGMNRADGINGLVWLAGSRILYSSGTGERMNLWSVSSDGADPRQLTDHSGRDNWPAVSPDRRWICFHRWNNLGRHLWRMDGDGANARQLTFGAGIQTSPAITPDGKWIYFSDLSTAIYRIPAEGGEPVPVFKGVANEFTISPRGGLASFWHSSPENPAIAVMRLDDHQIIRRINFLPSHMEWTPDGSAMYCIRGESGVSEIWSQPVDGGKPRQITNLKSQILYNFALSPDGKRFVLARGDTADDVVLIKEIRSN